MIALNPLPEVGDPKLEVEFEFDHVGIYFERADNPGTFEPVVELTSTAGIPYLRVPEWSTGNWDWRFFDSEGNDIE